MSEASFYSVQPTSAEYEVMKRERDEARAEVRRLRREAKAARRAAMEEAIRIVEAFKHIGPFDPNDSRDAKALYSNGTCERIACAIREALSRASTKATKRRKA